MSNRNAYTYVQGTSALEIPRQSPSNPNVMRVDFGKCADRTSSAAARDKHAQLRPQVSEANCRRFRGEGGSSSFAQDLKSAYLALGVSQVYEEFEQGNAAGSAAYRISPRVSWGFSFALFAFSLFVLLV